VFSDVTGVAGEALTAPTSVGPPAISIGRP
jgi:hypothetical protein